MMAGAVLQTAAIAADPRGSLATRPAFPLVEATRR
jgi:hypothetical protein